MTRNTPPAGKKCPSVTVGNISLDTFVTQAKCFEQHYLPLALEDAIEYAGPQGVVASLPYFVACKANIIHDDIISHSRYLWHSCLSEEYAGIDTRGQFARRGKPILIVCHGGGILTPKRLHEAPCPGGITAEGSVNLTALEFENVLRGVLPSGEQIEIYTIQEAKEGKIPNPFGRYAIALDYCVAKAAPEAHRKKAHFMLNPYVLARAGTEEHLDKYWEKAKPFHPPANSFKPIHFGNYGCNTHILHKIDFRQPQGWILEYNNWHGLTYTLPKGCARYLAVRPEAHCGKLTSI